MIMTISTRTQRGAVAREMHRHPPQTPLSPPGDATAGLRATMVCTGVPSRLQARRSPRSDMVTTGASKEKWALWGSNPRPMDYWVRTPLVDRAVILTWLWLGAVGISPTVEVRPQLAAASLSLLEGEQRSEQAGLNPERPADPRRRSRSAGTPPRRPGNAHAYPRAFRTLRRRTGTPSGTFRARRG